MRSEAHWRVEWERLRADRDRARRQWRGAADGLAARFRDPLDVARLAREHPIAAGGIGAAAGALLVKFLLRRAPAARDDAGGVRRPTSVWGTVLRDAALSIALPWLLRTLKEKFGWDLGVGEAPVPDAPRTTAADAAPPPIRR